MPYTEPKFEDEGKIERLIEDSAQIQTSSVNKKKRTRREFETPYSNRPLLGSTDSLTSSEASCQTKSKLSKHVLFKTSSTNLNQRRIVMLK